MLGDEGKRGQSVFWRPKTRTFHVSEGHVLWRVLNLANILVIIFSITFTNVLDKGSQVSLYILSGCYKCGARIWGLNRECFIALEPDTPEFRPWVCLLLVVWPWFSLPRSSQLWSGDHNSLNLIGLLWWSGETGHMYLAQLLHTVKIHENPWFFPLSWTTSISVYIYHFILNFLKTCRPHYPIALLFIEKLLKRIVYRSNTTSFILSQSPSNQALDPIVPPK